MSLGTILEFAPQKVSNGEYITHQTIHHDYSIAGSNVYFQV